MNRSDEPFIPTDPGLYGPDPETQRRHARPLREILGLTTQQFAAIVIVSLLIFAFLGGPFWAASRTAFPLRLFVSYLIIPVMVVALLWSNRTLSWQTAFAASAAASGIKFAVTVIVDVLHGLLRHWPP